MHKKLLIFALTTSSLAFGSAAPQQKSAAAELVSALKLEPTTKKQLLDQIEEERKAFEQLKRDFKCDPTWFVQLDTMTTTELSAWVSASKTATIAIGALSKVIKTAPYRSKVAAVAKK